MKVWFWLLVEDDMNMDDLESIEDKIERTEYIWCMHCEQAYHKSKIVVRQDCPVPGCDGRGFGFDLDTWDNMRELYPHYPEVPAEGVVYPLYP
jgi:hypothetical protein